CSISVRSAAGPPTQTTVDPNVDGRRGRTGEEWLSMFNPSDSCRGRRSPRGSPFEDAVAVAIDQEARRAVGVVHDPSIRPAAAGGIQRDALQGPVGPRLPLVGASVAGRVLLDGDEQSVLVALAAGDHAVVTCR